jgi:hypothetical protein
MPDNRTHVVHPPPRPHWAAIPQTADDVPLEERPHPRSVKDSIRSEALRGLFNWLIDWRLDAHRMTPNDMRTGAGFLRGTAEWLESLAGSA